VLRNKRDKEKWMKSIKCLLSIVLIIFVAVFLTSCSNSSSSSSSTPTLTSTLGGVVAVGTPIVDGNISVICAAGSPISTTTDAGGAWQVTSSGETFPCAVEVSGGTINEVANTTNYNSIAISAGIVNVTPLTDLLVANLVGTAPSTWFAGLSTNSAPLASITQTQVNTALTNLSTTLLSGLTQLSANNPITTTFTPISGNVSDDMLTALLTAMTNTGVPYTTLLGDASTATPITGFNTALTTAYSQTPSGSAPQAPTGVIATPGNGEVTITWPAVANATSYNIYWSTTSGLTTNGTEITGVTNPYIQTGLTNGTPYYYVVTAVNGNGESTASPQVTATPAVMSNYSVTETWSVTLQIGNGTTITSTTYTGTETGILAIGNDGTYTQINHTGVSGIAPTRTIYSGYNIYGVIPFTAILQASSTQTYAEIQLTFFVIEVPLPVTYGFGMGGSRCVNFDTTGTSLTSLSGSGKYVDASAPVYDAGYINEVDASSTASLSPE
jgi:uncharacterized membrane protein